MPKTLGERVRGAGLTAWALIGILVLVYLAVRYLVSPIAVIFPPIAIAVVVVYLLNPPVARLQRAGVRRGVGVLLIYLLFVGVVGVGLWFVIPLVSGQMSDLLTAVPGYVTKATDQINEFASRRGLDVRVHAPGNLSDLIRENKATILSFLGGLRAVAGTIVHVMITVVLGMVLSIYVLLDLPKIQDAIKRAIPQHRRADVLGLMEQVGAALGGFFRGQLLVAAFVGVASAIALTLVKLPFAVVIGLTAGFFNLIPMVGPYLAAVPAVSIGLLSDHPIRALWAAVALLVVQQIDNHIVSPNIVGRTVRLHPIVVMLALLAGGTLAGIPGMVAAIPSVAAGKVIVRHVWERRVDYGMTGSGVEKADGPPTSEPPIEPVGAAE